jgi:hypothetical protein
MSTVNVIDGVSSIGLIGDTLDILAEGGQISIFIVDCTSD